MIKIKNTLGKQLENFIPLEPGVVKFYQCGPTVYSRQHIGNLRAAALGDFIRRSLMYLGYDVTYVRNITDVGHLVSDSDNGEDKMAKGARREGLTPAEIAAKYTHIYHEDLNQLNVMPPTHEPMASTYVAEMQRMISVLLEKGYAYITPAAVYFDISKAEDYTRLSGQKLDLNQVGAGHGTAEDTQNKRNPQDFALWFFKTGEHANALQVWPSPFQSSLVEEGLGLPGWHIECSAMVKGILGNTIDIHMGGVEHIPIHHTNEIAQSESANGEPYVKYWLHNEHLQLDNGKMAKSEGRVVYVSDIAAKYPPLALRYFFLQSHYRSKQNFTWEALSAAASGLNRMQETVAGLYRQLAVGYDPLPAAVSIAYDREFKEALEDDFNLPQALAVAWSLLKDSNVSAEMKINTIGKFDEVLGLKLSEIENPKTEQQLDIPNQLQALLNLREQARVDKDWATADALRDQIKAQFGYTVVDTQEGQELQQ